MSWRDKVTTQADDWRSAVEKGPSTLERLGRGEGEEGVRRTALPRPSAPRKGGTPSLETPAKDPFYVRGSEAVAGLGGPPKGVIQTPERSLADVAAPEPVVLKPNPEFDGFFGRQGIRIYQSLAQGGAGLANAAVALGIDPGGYLSDKLDASSAFRGAHIEGDTTFQDVKDAQGILDTTVTALKLGVEQGPASLVQSPLYLNPYGIAVGTISNAGNIARQRADADGRTVADGLTPLDLAIATPFAVASSALEKTGIEKIIGAEGANAAVRIAKGAISEGGTEFIQNPIEYAGGSLGTREGFDPAQALDQGLEGGLIGAIGGGGLRGVIEGGSAAKQRLVGPRPGDTRIPGAGVIEQAGIPAVTQADVNSPLDTADIAAGRAAVAKATARKTADAGLQAAGVPSVGTRVSVTMPDGSTIAGTMEDHFTGNDGAGVVIRRDDGRKMREYFDTLDELGVTISPEAPAPLDESQAPATADASAANAIDARLAASTPSDTAPREAGGSNPAPAAAGQAGVQPAAPSKSPSGRNPVADGGAVIRSIFGGKARITQTTRDPNSALGKKNPGSWHIKSHAAVDMAPIAGMTFEQAKAAIEAKGYHLIEAIDEVSHPSKHATGPHWHFVIGEGGPAISSSDTPPAPDAPATDDTAPAYGERVSTDMPEATFKRREDAEQPQAQGAAAVSSLNQQIDGGDTVGFEASDGRVEVTRTGRDTFKVDRGSTEQSFSRADLEKIADAEGWQVSTRTRAEAQAAQREEGRARFAAKQAAPEASLAPQATAPLRPDDTSGTIEAPAPAPKAEPASTAAPKSASKVRMEVTSSGKGLALFDASEAELAAVAAAGIPVPPVRADGARVFSNKRAEAIRAAIAGVSESGPAAPVDEDTERTTTAIDYDSSERHERVAKMQAAGVNSVELVGGAKRNSGTPFDDLPRSVQEKLHAYRTKGRHEQAVRQALAETSRKTLDKAAIVKRRAELLNRAPLPVDEQFADMIEARDYEGLRGILRPDNPKSRQVFAEATGIKLPKTQRDTFAALRQWAGVSEEEEAARQKAEDDKVKAESAARDRQFAADAAQSTKVRDPDGNITNVKDFIDTKIAEGYDRLDNFSRGAVPKYYLANSEGHGFKLTGDMLRYARVALEDRTVTRDAGSADDASQWAANGQLADLSETKLRSIPELAGYVKSLDDMLASGKNVVGEPFSPEQLANLREGRKTAQRILDETEAERQRKMGSKPQSEARLTPDALENEVLALSSDQYLRYLDVLRPPSPANKGAITSRAAQIQHQFNTMGEPAMRAALAEVAKPKDRSATIIIDPAAGTVKTVPHSPTEKRKKDDSNPLVRKGERYTVKRAITGEYVREGETYLIERGDKSSAYFRNEEGSGTFIRNFNIRRALADGSLVKAESVVESATAKPEQTGPTRTYDVASLANGMSIEEAAKVARQTEAAASPTPATQSAETGVKAADYGAKNRLVTREQAEDIRAKLRAKLNPGRLNSGIDPEILALGTQLAVYHIEAGARRFADFARAVADDLGMNLADLRANLRGWYNGARDTMEDMGESVVGMDDADEVARAMRQFDRWATVERPSDTDVVGGTAAASAAPPPPAAGAAEPSAPVDSTIPREVQAVRNHLLAGNAFATIVEARKFLEDVTGEKIRPGTPEAKRADETIEAGVVQAARSIAARGLSPIETYRALVDLYGRQPSLNVRSSTSIEQQAYSTPVPLAYLASKRAGITQQTTVYEPSAGNGALLIDARATYVTANELNPDRAAQLRSIYQGATVTEGDALSDNLMPKQFDVMIANPPFGVVKGEDGENRLFDVGGGYVTREIDHAIAMKALEKIKDGGRAVLIVGSINKTISTEKGRADAYNAKAKREFYYRLYSEYNVTDHFTVAGELYARQGAGWPVDVIVIEGRGKSGLPLPAVKPPRIYGSWTALEEALDRGSNVQPATGAAADLAADPGTRPNGSDGRDRDGRDAGWPDRFGQRTEAVEPGDVRERPAGREPVGERLDDAAPGANAEPAGNERTRADRRPPAVKREPVAGENARQVTYTPASGARSLDTLVPVNMQTAISTALGKLQDRVGKVDAFVADRLGYSESEIGDYFSAEQVDALALALDNMERGAGFIIGDQTGIGKGRVVAGVIRYALRSGRMPIFVTEKPNLYADMYRDMNDIGIPAMLGRPVDILMTNAAEKVPLNEDGSEELKTGPAGQHNQILNRVADGEREGVDVLFTTYSQMQAYKGDWTPRQRAIERLAPGSIIIFDESHNAGGQGKGQNQRKTKKQIEAEEAGLTAPNRAEFARQIARKAHGVFFSSATYAKRPDVMDLYASTDMRLAVADIDKLGEAIAKGGIPMQQVVAAMLTESGQYVRRERSFEGVEYRTPPVEVDRQSYSQFTGVLRAIQDFQEQHVKDAVEGIADDIRAQAAAVSFDGSVGSAGATSTNFTSVMHNIVEQMLLAMKAKPAAEKAIEALGQDKKVVITVANTMGSFIKEYAEENGIGNGQAMPIDFRSLLVRYLDRTRRIMLKKPFSKDKGEVYILTDDDLGPAGAAAYRRVREQIEAMDLGDVPVSPVDYMRHKIMEAGYTVGEITGRSETLDYSKGKPRYRIRPGAEKSIQGRRAAITGFNNGKIDAMILNQAGSTGLSLHASATFKDKRQRVMIIAQAERNIDTHMQMLGRIHRTGQVVLPEYDQLVAAVPAEMRPAAVLAKKMASLNANTTGARDSAMTGEDVPDFLNQYGDEIAARMMEEDSFLHDRLGKPLKGSQGDEEGLDREDAARKVTGRLMLLPLDQQERFYEDFLAEYQDFLAQKEAAGEAALEAKTLDLDAKTLENEQVIAPTDSTSPFGEGVYRETIDVKRLGKPMQPEQIVDEVAQAIGDVPETFDRNGASALQDLATGGAAWMGKWRQQWLDDFDGYRRDILDGLDDNKVPAQAEKLNDIRSSFWQLSSLLYPGATVQLTSADGDVMHGVVLGIERKGSAKNPLALGAFRATFAFAEGTGRTTIPFSQLRSQDMADLASQRTVYPIKNIDGIPVMQAFSEMQVEAREKRTVLTGNMLAAYDHMRGQIVNFVDHEGGVRPGILMRRGFNYGKEVAKRPVQFRSPEQVVAWLMAGKAAFADGVSVENRSGTLVVTTAASKASGGRYFLDQGVRSAVGGDFFKKSTGMVAETSFGNARGVVAALQSAGAIFTAKTDLDEARKIVAGEGAKQSIPEREPVARLTGKELGQWSDMLDLIKKARAWYRNKLRPTSIVASDGARVRFTRAGEGKINAGDRTLRAVPAIPAILEKGEHFGPFPPSEKWKAHGVVAAHRYVAPVEIDGQTYRFGVLVQEMQDGRRFYVLSDKPDGMGVGGRASLPEGVSRPGPKEITPDTLNIFAVDETDKSGAGETAPTSDELQQALEKLGLARKVAVRVVDSLGGAAGDYGASGEVLIRVATDTAQDGMFTLHHEAIHALRDLGLFNQSEWAILAAKAKRDTMLMRSIKARYGHLTAEEQVEEAIADMFARYQSGAYKPDGMAARVFKALRGALEAVRNWLAGNGGRTAENVMAATARGEVGSRKAAAEIVAAPVEQVRESRPRPETAEMLDLGGREPTWQGKMADAFDQWRTRMQDRFLPLLRVQQQIEELTGKTLPERMNPYLGEELMTGRIGARLETLADDHVQPLFDAMHSAGVTTEELETYLYARHAPERNARILEINPEFTEGEGSGMTDLEAAAIMSRIRKSGKMEVMERLAARVDAIRDMALDQRVESGLMSEAQAEEWRSTYEHYVPLRGFKEVEGEDDWLADRINRSGGGINVRGRESKAAYGRRSQADSPLAYTILQAEEAIVRGETNRVAQRFINLARANPSEDFWQVNKVSGGKRMNPDTGLVENYLNTSLTAADKDWTVSAKFNGKEVRVTMDKTNPAARRLADAMRNLTQHELDFVTRYLGVVNRFLSAVNTSWNPEFVITNAFRDLQAATVNLVGVDVPGMTRKVLASYPKALAASMKGSFGRESGEWGRWYNEYEQAGGRVFFNKVENVSEIKKRIEKAMAMASAKPSDLRLQAKRVIFGARDFVENVNMGVESAVRLATYKAAREAGLSQDRAASIAKNVTVNFNRRGTFGPAMNAAYLFYNASIQGSVRILTALRSKRVRKMMVGVVATGFLLEMLNAMMSGTDDDGEDYYDKISDFDKSRNLIVMLGDGQFIRIPLPYGYNVFYNAGRTAAEVARRGGDRWLESAGHFLASAMDAFNPVGGSDSLLKFFSPTILDPIVDLEQNKDFSGKPIMPEQPAYAPPEADHNRYWGSVGPHWRAITDFLNEATGGNAVEPGAIDVSPETFEYLAGTAFGAAGAFADRVASVPSKAMSDEGLSLNDLPMARKVVGSKPGWYDKSAYYDRIAQVDQAVARGKDYLELDQPEAARAFVERNLKVLSLEREVKATKKEMRAVRKVRKETELAHDTGKIDDAEYRRRTSLIKQAETEVIRQFNTQWNFTMTGAKVDSDEQSR